MTKQQNKERKPGLERSYRDSGTSLHVANPDLIPSTTGPREDHRVQFWRPHTLGRGQGELKNP